MEVKDGYKQTDIGVIPKDWDVLPLPKALEFIGGKAHEQHISPSGEFIVVNSKFISSDGSVTKYSTMNFCPARRGDILMVMSDLPNGKALAKCFLVEMDERYAVNQRVCILRPKKGISKYFAYQLNRNPYFLAFNDGVSQTHLLNGVFRACPVLVPPPPEQRAIANVLSDVDDLIASLDALIAKKRDLKQAAMQQLLTGKIRLQGFSGEWASKKIAEISNVAKGKQIPRELINSGGLYPHLNGGTEPSNFSTEYNTDGGTIAVSEGGNSCGYVQYMAMPYWCGGHCYSVKSVSMHIGFLYQLLKHNQTGIMALRVGSGLPNVQKSALLGFELRCPLDIGEQEAISSILTDMDAEIADLEQRRDKTIAIKQGMMQELLTGRTRLV